MFQIGYIILVAALCFSFVDSSPEEKTPAKRFFFFGGGGTTLTEEQYQQLMLIYPPECPGLTPVQPGQRRVPLPIGACNHQCGSSAECNPSTNRWVCCPCVSIFTRQIQQACVAVKGLVPTG